MLPSADCCHWIEPVYPLTVTVVPLPVHTCDAAGVAVPPTEVGLTVNVPEPLLLWHPLLSVTTTL
jgi:hypothetical protein